MAIIVKGVVSRKGDISSGPFLGEFNSYREALASLGEVIDGGQADELICVSIEEGDRQSWTLVAKV